MMAFRDRKSSRDEREKARREERRKALSARLGGRPDQPGRSQAERDEKARRKVEKAPEKPAAKAKAEKRAVDKPKKEKRTVDKPKKAPEPARAGKEAPPAAGGRPSGASGSAAPSRSRRSGRAAVPSLTSPRQRSPGQRSPGRRSPGREAQGAEAQGREAEGPRTSRRPRRSRRSRRTDRTAAARPAPEATSASPPVPSPAAPRARSASRRCARGVRPPRRPAARRCATAPLPPASGAKAARPKVAAAGRRTWALAAPILALPLLALALAERWIRTFARIAGRVLAAATAFLDRHVTPARAVLLVTVETAVCLMVSQFQDYHGVEVGQPGYIPVEATVSADQVDIETPRDAHGSLLLILAGIAIVAAVAAAVTRRRALGLVVSAAGVAGLLVSILGDRPEGLDAGETAMACTPEPMRSCSTASTRRSPPAGC